MSYLINGVAYIIVNTADVTEEMINTMKVSFNTTATTIRTSDDGLLKLFKIKGQISSVFRGYKWFNSVDILVELDRLSFNE